MSRLGCVCGHTIRDQTNDLSYKAHCLPDLDCSAFFDWIASQTQSYVDAAKIGKTDAWLLGHGFSQDYVNLGLGDDAILHDLIHTRFLQLKREMFECENCGRVHIETDTENHFVSYSPDGGKVNAIFNSAQSDRQPAIQQ